MNNAVDKILSRAGENMRENLGAGGIRELLPVPPDAPPPSGDKLVGRTRNLNAGTIDIRQVVPDPNQPRQQFDEDEIDRLAESLKARGQLQNIRVRWNQGLEKWVIISGERRYRAAVKAGLPTLNCEFVEGELTDAEVLEDQLVENCLREDLNPVELATSYDRLMKLMGYTQQQLAAALSVSVGGVSKALAVLELPADLREDVREGRLSGASAYELSRLGGADAQREAARQVAEQGLTRDQVTELVQTRLGRRAHATSKTGQRFNCKLPNGQSVTVTAAVPLSLDHVIESLEAVLKAARKTRQKDGTLTDLAIALKAKQQSKEEEHAPAVV